MATGGRSRRRGHGSDSGKLTMVTGQLTLLLSVPLDVFFEITSHLRPLDILRLSRSSKAFRKMLLSRSSRHIWASARKNVYPPLPDCPDDLSEPLYASLMFERTCLICGASRAFLVDYAAYIRLCEACMGPRIEHGGKLAYESGMYYDPDFVKIIYDLLPGVTSPDLWQFAPAAAQAQYPQMAAQVAALNGAQPAQTQNQFKQNEHTMFYKGEFVRLTEEYRKMQAGETRISLKQFVVKNRNRTITRLKFSRAMTTWSAPRANARMCFEQWKTTARKLAIEEELSKLGYEAEDYPTNSSEFSRLVTTGRDLSPRIWSNIKPTLLQLLAAERESREDQAFRTKWRSRISELEHLYEQFVGELRYENLWSRKMPSFSQMLQTTVMDKLITSARPNEPLTEEQFAVYQPVIAEAARDARAKLRRKLAKLLREASASASASDSPAGDNRKSTSKGKGKARATSQDVTTRSDLSEDQIEAEELALLDCPTSLFQCTNKSCVPKHAMYYGAVDFRSSLTLFGLLAHQSVFHSGPLDTELLHVRVADSDVREQMWDLVDALGLPRDTTLSSLCEVISSGRVQCACWDGAEVATWAANEDFILAQLLAHLKCDTTRTFPMHGGISRMPQPKHKFTVIPYTPNDDPRGNAEVAMAMLDIPPMGPAVMPLLAPSGPFPMQRRTIPRLPVGAMPMPMSFPFAPAMGFGGLGGLPPVLHFAVARQQQLLMQSLGQTSGT